MDGLRDAMPYVMLAALAAVALVLLAGLVSMVRGGAFNRRHGNRIMRLRVAAQGAALLLFLFFMYLTKS